MTGVCLRVQTANVIHDITDLLVFVSSNVRVKLIQSQNSTIQIHFFFFFFIITRRLFYRTYRNSVIWRFDPHMFTARSHVCMPPAQSIRCRRDRSVVDYIRLRVILDELYIMHVKTY